AGMIEILPLFYPSLCLNPGFYWRKARDSAAMPLKLLNKGFAKAVAGAIRAVLILMEWGLAVELPN
ncbi:MAG: hypothetical protein KA117_11860, partial [Verrucomicrobia bacterium]|nr:hypothetical protein [Verrucomicrobiota bacterium]